MRSRTGAIGLYRRIAVTYWSHARRLLAIAVVVFVPLGLVEALSGRLLDVDLESVTELELVAVVTAGVAQGGTALLGEVFYSGAVAALIVGARTGSQRPLGKIARELPYWRLIVIDLLFSIGLLVALLLLVVPAFVFLVYFSLTAPVAEIEDRGVRAAFRRSAQLVRGRFWTVLAVVVPVSIGIELLSEAGGSIGETLLGHNLLGDWLGTAVVEIAATPVYAAAVVVMALELIEARGERPRASAPPD